MKKRARFWSQDGFTLVEILVSLTVLLISAVAFLPLFVFLSESTQANKARLTASSLASNVIEEIRALPYNQIGLAGGNPPGAVQHETTVTIGGREYTVRTNIWWVNDASDDSGGNDPIPYDYKRVQVTVTAPGLFPGAVTITENINTLAALEGEEEAFPGGNLLALAQRGWQTAPGDPVPVESAEVELTTGPDAPQTQWTDETGRALFAVLGAGTYTVAAQAGALGMMVRPDQQDQTVDVVDGKTNTVIFQVEEPCFLDIQLTNAVTGSPIDTGGSLILTTPFGTINKTFTADREGSLPPEFLGELWPVGAGYAGAPYNLQVMAAGYLPYNLGDHPEVWDGIFSAPGETKNLTLALTPANAGVTVTSAGAGTPVSGASVEIYLHTYTYHETGGWSDACALLQTATTQADGRASFALPDNNPCEPPLTPQEGDQYTRYCVKVTAPGYLSLGPVHGTFWITGGRQMTGTGAVETYAVTLQPDFRSIRVRTEKNNGTPRNNVQIKVEGSGGYSEQKQTGSQGVPGEALFENLAPGTYNVYRKSGIWWVDHREVEVVSGEYLVLYRY